MQYSGSEIRSLVDGAAVGSVLESRGLEVRFQGPTAEATKVRAAMTDLALLGFYGRLKMIGWFLAFFDGPFVLKKTLCE
jgi:hypothetical protein